MGVHEEITVKDIPPRTVVCLRYRGSWRQLPEMADRLDRYVSQTSIETIGPASGIYYNTPSEVGTQDLEWEIFYSIKTAETPESFRSEKDFGIRKLPRVKVASITHRGSYRNAISTYEHLEEWIKRERYKISGPSEEVYLSVFGVPSDEQTMEIRIPVSST